MLGTRPFNDLYIALSSPQLSPTLPPPFTFQSDALINAAEAEHSLMDQRKAAQDKMRGMAEAMRLLEEHKRKQAEEKVSVAVVWKVWGVEVWGLGTRCVTGRGYACA